MSRAGVFHAWNPNQMFGGVIDNRGHRRLLVRDESGDGARLAFRSLSVLQDEPCRIRVKIRAPSGIFEMIALQVRDTSDGQTTVLASQNYYLGSGWTILELPFISGHDSQPDLYFLPVVDMAVRELDIAEVSIKEGLFGRARLVWPPPQPQ